VSPADLPLDIDLMEDEELTFVYLIMVSSDMRYIDTGNMLS
jgi:hypothetical protein